MGNRGKAKKKLALPPSADVSAKRIGDPSRLLPAADTSSDRLCWRFTHVDHGGRWGFANVEPELLCEILKKLADCESMTMNEIRNTRKLLVEYRLPGKLCKEALDRLTAMKRDDMTSIHRLDFKGKQRLYGFLEGNVFHVAWWDPEHEIYPWVPRNT
ncbi:hypothetical protein [Streptomyces sp. 4R-3d]|uniref:hypothetical protein n=1 Tax=Streptomyces sp. 4R-3d TaxID=2559605 RepID=UPI00107219A4|nr:hypothetical protein [Streptomyces sp. 4R-3d]TFI30120.1 hypothetical protein E4P36_05060 [Streptomyces sp. 4R-3d]